MSNAAGVNLEFDFLAQASGIDLKHRFSFHIHRKLLGFTVFTQLRCSFALRKVIDSSKVHSVKA